MKIGVVAIQGSVEEHIEALQKTLDERKERCDIIRAKRSDQMKDCSAIIIPGGESTTIGRLMHRSGIDKEVIRHASLGTPILGTCAGLVLLAKEVVNGDERVYNLGLMDVSARRNAFGRQRESFEAPLSISVLGDRPYNAVFIRAPAITKVGKNVEVLAKLDKFVVAAMQKNLIALSFHPELGDDRRFHHFFLDLI
mgnify:CR=1 FL=1